MDREENYKYLNGELKFDESEEKGYSYLFYEEWLKKTASLKNLCLEKTYIIDIICSNKSVCLKYLVELCRLFFCLRSSLSFLLKVFWKQS